MCKRDSRCTASRSTNRDETNASVAPSDEANDTTSVPATTPKIAPAASVITTAPGSDAAATST